MRNKNAGLPTVEKAEAAQRIAEFEAQKRISGEMKALKEAEKKNIVLNKFTQYDIRYRKYNIEDIESATYYFAESHKIGEGGYRPVYKSFLDHTQIAIQARKHSSRLLFLHQAKPKDLKPTNILLDRNFVSKITDVGPARLSLDPQVHDWPVEEAIIFAELRRKDRPNLGTVVLPKLNRFRMLAKQSMPITYH
ncbi:hypothetical protein SASPL_129920 [Salvia splendens]|uniref:RING-type E3 ubiquitin transferase n=1 Tax=Salvia splendens TaxID=180675 RepID=A0A8X8ZP82_SALSN|nr:hypothetical protein SASPL_129920 [Salvia splendens]